MLGVVPVELFVLLYLTPISSSPSIKNKKTLVLLHVLFRHGDRTPEAGTQFPTDPYLNDPFEPFGYGQLTRKGRKREYNIGKYLRSRYKHFIPKQYTPDVVNARTTNVKRTKMSLQLVLASLLPPDSSDKIADDLNWQPVPYDVDQEEVVIGLPMLSCAKFIKEYHQYLESEEGRSLVANYTDLYLLLTTYTGMEVTTLQQVANIYSVLESYYHLGLELPCWTKGLFPEILSDAAGASLQLLSGNNILKKLSAGRLLKKILSDSMAARDKNPKTKVFLYSAHDVNVGTVLNTLNLFERHIPSYGATIYFEIHNIDETYGLKLYYKNDEEVEPKLLTIPGCSSFCDLDILYEILAPNLPGDDDRCVSREEYPL